MHARRDECQLISLVGQRPRIGWSTLRIKENSDKLFSKLLYAYYLLA
jgi:hypothetical protein